MNSFGRFMSGWTYCMLLNIFEVPAYLWRFGSSESDCICYELVIGIGWDTWVIYVSAACDSFILVITFGLLSFSVKSDNSVTSRCSFTFVCRLIFSICFLDLFLINSRSLLFLVARFFYICLRESIIRYSLATKSSGIV